MANTEIKLPDIGEGVNEGELVKWLVKPGDSVNADQPLAEVMTDKATVEIPSSVAGKVLELRAKVGELIPIGHVMLVIEGAGGASVASRAPASSASQGSHSAPPKKETPVSNSVVAPVKQPMAANATSAVPAVSMSSGGVFPPVADGQTLATPSTRRLAREINVDINQIKGSGLAGRVTRDDVMKNSSGAGAVAAGTPSYVPPKASLEIPAMTRGPNSGVTEERVPLIGVRKKIAEKMQLSKHVIPHFTLMEEVNVTKLVTWRADLKEKAAQYGVKVTYLPFMMKALIATVREYPMFNASIDDAAGEIVYKKYFNIGFAADTPEGLRVPVIKNADQKTILQISKEIMELSEKARKNKISADDMKGATLSITNIGSIGGTYATPIINHPEVAILGMYKIQEKPIFQGDEIVRAQIMNVTITCDHRLIDGAVAANFLKAFVGRLENPSLLVLDLA